MNQNFQIIGTGSALPQRMVTAADIERRAELPAGWVAAHTDVVTRYECLTPDSLASMAKEAIDKALLAASLSWSEIDLIIDCSTSRHQPIPCNGAKIQSLFPRQAAGIPCFDVQGTCLGFLLGLNIANALFLQEQYRTILLVASEATLTAANWNDSESVSLLGDGAAAVIVQHQTSIPGYGFLHETFSEFYEDCQVRGGGHDLPAFAYSTDNDDDFRFSMSGPRLFQTALRKLPPLVDSLLKMSQIDREKLLVIPHQASPKALELVRRRLGIEDSRFINVAQNFGNMAAASIPFVLDQFMHEKQLSRGQQVLLLGTSAGYSQAGLIFQQ